MSHLKSRRVVRIYEYALDVPAAGDMRPELLRQLRHAARIRARRADELNARALLMLDRTIWARFCHCMDAGIGEEAAQIIADVQRLAATPAFIRRGGK